MAHTVVLSDLTQERPGEEGGARLDYPEGTPEGPRWTRVARVILSEGSYKEPPEPDRVRFFYVLEGEATLSSDPGTPTVKKGNTLFLREEEGLHLTKISETPVVLLRFAVQDDSPPNGRQR
jgi:quercetin dioxygenase-like cupin family protein